MDRSVLIEHLYRDGRTLEAIGRLYDLSRERIRQILSKRGVHATDGGAQVSAKQRASERWNASKREKDKHSVKYYGCPHSVALEINGGRNLSDGGSPASCYRNQRRAASIRGIDWKFTLPEWWSVWQASGKWQARGRNKYDFCMARIKDAGAYEIGNVEIISMSQNVKDSYKSKPSIKRLAARSFTELTPRQKQIAKLASNGLQAKDIATDLHISPSTVRIHLCCIRKKLGLYERHYGSAASNVAGSLS